jgi:hypothetical protein
MIRTSAVFLVAIVSTHCRAPLMKLPSMPMLETWNAAPLVDAQLSCLPVRTMTTEVVMGGSLRGHDVTRIRLRASLSNDPSAERDSARLDAVGPTGDQLFNFAAQGNDATLLLPRQNRMLEHGHPEVVLEALIGVRLSPSALRTVLTGCAPGPSFDLQGTSQVGNDWQAVPTGNAAREEGNRVFLHRETRGPWRIVVATHREGRMDGWRAEYRDFQNGLPRSIRVVSNTRHRFDLRLSLAQVNVNVPLDTDTFRLRMPPSAEPITLGELLESRPLVDATSHGR